MSRIRVLVAAFLALAAIGAGSASATPSYGTPGFANCQKVKSMQVAKGIVDANGEARAGCDRSSS